MRPEVGDFILETRPESVVVETAYTRDHAAAKGARLTGQDLANSAEEWHQIALNLTAHLQAQVADSEADLTAAPLWQQVRVSAPAEQVALVAALAVAAPLVNGDRNREVTFRRLLNCTAEELDAAFGSQAAGNYEDLVCRNGGSWPSDKAPTSDAFDRIVLRERDAVLYHSLRSEARAVGEGMNVVGIVGSAHADAIAALHARATPTLDDIAPLLTSPELDEDQSYGCRRAIMERLLVLRSAPAMAAASQESLGDVGFAHVAAYEDTNEMYANCRMLLACLTEEQLRAVVSTRKGCQDMWDVLQVVRQARPTQGGKGYSAPALETLRTLPVLS